MNPEITEDNLHRLALCVMQKNGCTLPRAMQMLEDLRLTIICGDSISGSVPLQAALLTAVNTGARAFLGGVTVVLPSGCPCLLPWPSLAPLESIVISLGAEIVASPSEGTFSLYLGAAPPETGNALQVACNGWQAGVLLPGEENCLVPEGNSPLGGIAAGALGVALAFLSAAGIRNAAENPYNGVSLWRPDLHWLDTLAYGPPIRSLPKQYWLLGLGHLGQGYLWNIGLLPFQETTQVNLMLQDFDRVVFANLGAGLLLTDADERNYKTRVCSGWLEARGFQTVITERPFDGRTVCGDNEPRVALCGFDNAPARALLENAGFDFVVEAALGGALGLFDNIVFHTFPGSYKTTAGLWGNAGDGGVVHQKVLEQFQYLNNAECGVIAETLASKAISTAFVGAFAGALAVAELVRGLNGGLRYDTIVMALRAVHNKKALAHGGVRSLENLAPNGFTEVKE